MSVRELNERAALGVEMILQFCPYVAPACCLKFRQQ